MIDEEDIKMNLKGLLVLFCLLLFCSCTTKFFGSPHVDREDCQKKCDAWNMELSGMVAMGEYSSGCVCKEKLKNRSEINRDENSFGAATAAAVGVVTLMEEEAASSQAHH